MSESIQVAEPPRPEPKASSTKTTVIVLTTVMTAVTTIAVAFIGIVPQLRGGQKVETPAPVSSAAKPESNAAIDKVLTDKTSISGTVKSENGAQTLSGVEVYLLPADYKLTAKTDDSGKFAFKQLPPGTYSIIVRESTNGKSGRGLLDERENEVRISGALVKYNMQK